MYTILTHEAAATELATLPSQIRGRMFRLIERLAIEGNALRMPHSRVIGGGIFELRVGDKDIARSLYAFARGQNIYLLHAFVKKTEKTPAAAIKTAHMRLKEFK
ncbi:type II toxin-antitoxin system RelE/ParE family toxin [Photorhabdus luminescens]|uniref:Type II toxin-antitoxin system RelE/ParE family toxin n=1 Tax=Photorhabdus luminescens subsp. sonorensis TaxID=1173677 RepID=A0A5C4RD61_PHOLU|nr:type II toxin-antitoxin system RelE/ParE family toxin [Photorhabdus luminescens]TNH41808.1 type II toxin-antitoxin system RelE/ParE family toxin [Photorhabdus luminescens subsp. sonorensis]